MPLPDSEAFNVQFVAAVESCRCLYDTSLAEYRSQDEQDRRWTLIADKFSCTAAECRLRWKYLRGGLTRYIKKLKDTNGAAAKTTKQYYLWDVMQFVIPYLKSKEPKGSLSTAIVGSEDDDLDETEGEFVDCKAMIVDSASKVGPETGRHSSNSFKTGRKRSMPAVDDSYKTTATTYVEENSFQKPENPDLAFFISVLPDMAKLNASQKRRFKLGVLQLLENISTEETLASN